MGIKLETRDLLLAVQHVFRALRWPRGDMVLVAAAGPAMNIALAVAAALAFHIVAYVPATGAQWLVDNLKNALIINVVPAVFNLFPLPPLDGGRILVGILPKAAAAFVARLEPYGLAGGRSEPAPISCAASIRA